MTEKINYNKGNGSSPVAFLFACPGQKEQKAGKVVAGSTGRNLNLLLSALSSSESSFIKELFPSEDRYDYLITNASNVVHYPAWDETSLPKKEEYSAGANLSRLFYELEDMKYVIAFGVQAKETAKLLELMFDMRNVEPRPTFITSLPHLSFLSLNQISKDVNGNDIVKGDKEGTAKRIQVVRKQLEEAVLAMKEK